MTFEHFADARKLRFASPIWGSYVVLASDNRNWFVAERSACHRIVRIVYHTTNRNAALARAKGDAIAANGALPAPTYHNRPIFPIGAFF